MKVYHGTNNKKIFRKICEKEFLRITKFLAK